MPSGVYKRTSETKRILSEAHRGKILSDEHKSRIGQASRETWADPEYRESRRGTYLGSPTEGRGLNKEGYVELSGQYGHPLAFPNGTLLEHRKVLYSKLGPGVHPCNWCSQELSWGGIEGIVVDHLDEDKSNNDPENLVPSCSICNMRRGQ